MPAVTIVFRRAAGRIYVRRGKVEVEFDSLAHLRAWVRANRSPRSPESDLADALEELAKNAQSPADLDALSGRTVNVTVTAVVQ